MRSVKKTFEAKNNAVWLKLNVIWTELPLQDLFFVVDDPDIGAQWFKVLREYNTQANSEPSLIPLLYY